MGRRASNFGLQGWDMIPSPPSRTRPSLARGADRARKMVAQQKSPAGLVGHYCGGVAIMKAGDRSDFIGLATIAALPRTQARARAPRDSR
jgi:hypothetical protein